MLTEEQKKEIKKKLRKIELPIGLEYKLAQKIIERFDKAGLFYHYRSRIKAEKSIIHKYYFKSISEDHRIQDMIGIKFVFCFVDDLKMFEYAKQDASYILDHPSEKDHAQYLKSIDMDEKLNLG